MSGPFWSISAVGRPRTHGSRRAAAGEVIEVSDQGRPIAVITRAPTRGLAELEEEELLQRGEGDLLALVPLSLPAGAQPPSERIVEDSSA